MQRRTHHNGSIGNSDGVALGEHERTTHNHFEDTETPNSDAMAAKNAKVAGKSLRNQRTQTVQAPLARLLGLPNSPPVVLA